jgi:hypothetical protein
MDVWDLAEAIAESERFLIKAREAVSRIRETGEGPLVCGTKETGAARRASLDLTRALANLRRT